LVQPNWEQYDETAADFIKNKPFYDSGRSNWIEILNNPEIQKMPIGNGYQVAEKIVLECEKNYKVIFNEEEYICTSRQVKYADTFSSPAAIGAELSGGLVLSEGTLVGEEFPFHIATFGNNLCGYFNEVPTNL
jgi:hypothetical protein